MKKLELLMFVLELLLKNPEKCGEINTVFEEYYKSAYETELKGRIYSTNYTRFLSK